MFSLFVWTQESNLVLLRNISQPATHQLFDNCFRQWFIDSKLDSALAQFIVLELSLELQWCAGEKAHMIFKAGIINQIFAFIFESRNAIANNFIGLWHHLPD